MESFHKVIESLEFIEGGQGSASSARQSPQGASREITKMTNFSLPTNGTVISQQAMYNPAFSRASPSRLATCGSTVRKKNPKQVYVLLNYIICQSRTLFNQNKWFIYIVLIQI